jgi:hypothetical protein
MGTAAERAKAAAVAQVFAYLHRHRIALDDLIDIGGDELKAPNAVRRECARRVEQCWSLIARLRVDFAALTGAAPQHPVKPSRRRRGEGVCSQAIENTDVSGVDPPQVKSLKTHDIPDNHPVEGSGKGRWRHKRRLASGAAS